MPRNPNLSIKPSREGDMPRCSEIMSAAFASEGIGPLLFGPHEPASWAKTAAAHWRAHTEHAAVFPSAPFCIKCVHTDPATGEETIVGTAEWAIYDRERTPDGVARRPVHQPLRNFVKGRRYGLLTYMAVDEAWRRQGAATLCVRWGMDRCAELGIPAYLEATEEGMKTYVSMGWEKVELGDLQYPPMMWWPEGVEKWTELQNPVDGPQLQGAELLSALCHVSHPDWSPHQRMYSPPIPSFGKTGLEFPRRVLPVARSSARWGRAVFARRRAARIRRRRPTVLVDQTAPLAGGLAPCEGSGDVVTLDRLGLLHESSPRKPANHIGNAAFPHSSLEADTIAGMCNQSRSMRYEASQPGEEALALLADGEVFLEHAKTAAEGQFRLQEELTAHTIKSKRLPSTAVVVVFETESKRAFLSNMLMTSLVSIQAASVFTAETVPIEKTYGLPAESKDDPSASATSESSPSSSTSSSTSNSVTWSP
ncbi:hypothetical protein NLG97_g9714 [Lecanicillium saksenae]|uniref:Uncharacterized protein n=1 Tax=Lecanicillium saksenae TaxID=468837 RepID=A0ACC1QHQ2_9HYPO|nr:hypothetical protein NLG97_g9714 [Lecanicillium saksenae]